MTDPVDQLAARPPPSPPPLPAALEAELAHLTPVPPRRPMRQLVVLSASSLAYAAVLVAVLSVRGDLDELPVAWLAAAGLAWLGGFAITCYLALVPPPGQVSPRPMAAATAAAIAAIGFVALGLAVHPSGPHSSALGWDHIARGHGCLWLGLGTALVPVGLGAMFLRGAAPVGSRWIAAALGAGAGCLGGLLLHLHCAIADAPHVGLIHGGVVMVSAVLSAALVPSATGRTFR